MYLIYPFSQLRRKIFHSLKLYKIMFAIDKTFFFIFKARVTNKSDIRRWSNARGEGHLFSMDLIDESGEIRATAFKAECDKYYEMIEIGKVYYITQGTLKAANKQYSNLNNDYELTFKDSTEVVPCTDEEETSKIPTVQFDFCKINQLDASLKVPFIYYLSTFI